MKTPWLLNQLVSRFREKRVGVKKKAGVSADPWQGKYGSMHRLPARYRTKKTVERNALRV